MTQALEDSTSPVTMLTKRGRKALPTNTADVVNMEEAEHYAVAAAPALEELRKNSVTLYKGELAQSLHMAQGMGMFQALDYIQKFSGIARLKWLADRKESCDYKGASVVGRDGTMHTIKNFDDLCDFVGHSRSKIHEDLQNLSTFGEGLLEAQEALGLGYRELRRLRAGIKSLPPEEQQKILDDVQAADGSEEAKAALDDLKIKLATTEMALKDAKDDMSAKEKLSKAKSERLDKLQEQVIKLTCMSPDEQDKLSLEKNQQAKKEFDALCLNTMGTFAALAQKAAAILQHEESSLDTCRYVHGRVSLLCQNVAETLTLAGVDVSFGEYFELSDIGEDAGVQGTTSTEGEA